MLNTSMREIGSTLSRIALALVLALSPLVALAQVNNPSSSASSPNPFPRSVTLQDPNGNAVGGASAPLSVAGVYRPSGVTAIESTFSATGTARHSRRSTAATSIFRSSEPSSELSSSALHRRDNRLGSDHRSGHAAAYLDCARVGSVERVAGRGALSPIHDRLHQRNSHLFHQPVRRIRHERRNSNRGAWAGRNGSKELGSWRRQYVNPIQ